MEKIVRKFSQKQQPSDADYWRQQSPDKRVEALEQIRREYHQFKYNAQPRLQRVYRIVKKE